ncbi:hypothetical protein OKW21_005103 [Catalinimonas alkaloidigena]|nr:hypothetical protein [Catalinimonas alkaloidigena]
MSAKVLRFCKYETSSPNYTMKAQRLLCILSVLSGNYTYNFPEVIML